MAQGRKIAVVLAVLLVASACGWKQTRFDAGRSANNPLEQSITLANVNRLVAGWSATGNQFGGEAVVSGGRVAAQDRTGVSIFNAATGAHRWSAPFPTSSTTVRLPQGVSFATAADGREVVVSAVASITVPGQPQVTTGQVTALDAATGAFLWSQPVGAITPPLIIEQTVFQLSNVNGVEPEFSGLVALDLTTGAVKFRVPLSSYGPALAAAGSTVLVGTSPGFAAIPAAGCGAAMCPVAWSGTSAGNVSNRLAAVNDSIYLVSDAGLERYPAGGCSAATCAPTWRGAGDYGALAVGHGFVFVTPPTAGFIGKLVAFPAAGCGTALCTPAWESSDYKAYTAPSIAGNVLYSGALDGSLRAWKPAGCGAATCAPVWSTVLPNPALSPIVAYGRLYVPSLTLRTFQLPPA